MALAIDLSDHQAQALAEAAARLQISETDLAAASVRDLIAQPADDFNAAAQRCSARTLSCIGASPDALAAAG